MIEALSVLSFFQISQWVAAFLFVPLLCWYWWHQSTVFCRWCALLSGYAVQFGLIFLLVDSGFEMSTIVLFGALAASAWIKLMTGWLPSGQDAPG